MFFAPSLGARAPEPFYPKREGATHVAVNA
jgi:hypothetical protein